MANSRSIQPCKYGWKLKKTSVSYFGNKCEMFCMKSDADMRRMITGLYKLACKLAVTTLQKTVAEVARTKQTDTGIVMEYITHIHTNTIPLTFVYAKLFLSSASSIVLLPFSQELFHLVSLCKATFATTTV